MEPYYVGGGSMRWVDVLGDGEGEGGKQAQANKAEESKRATLYASRKTTAADMGQFCRACSFALARGHQKGRGGGGPG